MSEGSAVERLVPRSRHGAPGRDDSQEPAGHRLERSGRRHIDWPLAAVLTVQAVFSLSLVWSRSAYFDEAQHILDGKREWDHLLHGTALPPYSEAGARQIYPVIGYLAHSVAGLAGARILSLCFMLVASVLVYQTGVRLFGRTAALAGVALWAVSEPVLRLAFATWDPLACLLVITSLRLAVQAGVSRHKALLVALSGLALALSGVTALPFLIYLPVVIVVALLAWMDQLGARTAVRWTVVLALCTAVFAVALLTVLGLWSNVHHLEAYRPASAQPFFGSSAGRALVSKLALTWDGVIFVGACAGAVIAVASERSKARAVLVVALAASVLPVPLYQMHISASIGLDKQMSAGSGMAALAAGYLVARLRPESWRLPAAWLVAGVLMIYPAVSGLAYARNTFYSWPDTTKLMAALKPLAATKQPVLMSAADSTLTQLYLGGSGAHWREYSPASPSTVQVVLPAVRQGSYAAVVVQFQLAKLQSAGISRYIVQPGSADALTQKALTLMRAWPLTSTLISSADYKLSAVVPYKTTNTNDESGAWVIWKRVG